MDMGSLLGTRLNYKRDSISTTKGLTASHVSPMKAIPFYRSTLQSNEELLASLGTQPVTAH